MKQPAGVNRQGFKSVFFLPTLRFSAYVLLRFSDLGTFIEAAQAGSFRGRNVYEDILAATVGLYKSIALGRVEPLHDASRHVRTPF
jgi:hypothetical protein